MALLYTEAKKLSNNTLIQGIVEEIIDKDAMFALLPFVRNDSKAYVFNRENTISGGAWIDPYEAVPEGAADFSEITVTLKRLIGDVKIDKFILATTADTNDQIAIQLRQKAKGLKAQFQAALVNGDNSVNPKQFDGLKRLVMTSPNAATQTLDAGTNGAAITLNMLDELRDKVPLGADAFIMRSGTWRAIKQAMRLAGGVTPVMLKQDGFGFPVDTIDGMPVIINDYLPKDEVMGSNANTTSVYAVRFNVADGVHGLYAGNTAGITVENLGTTEGEDSLKFRMKFYAGLAMKSTRSVARLRGITNV